MNVLVTGGATGLGVAITRELSKVPDDFIYFTYCRSSHQAEQIQKEIPNSRMLFCDFNDKSSVKSLADSIEGLNLDVLINNAWTSFESKHFHKVDLDKFESSFHSNVVATLRVSQASIKAFRKRGSGKIINILSSSLLNKPPLGYSEYAASKAFLASMSKTWASEYSKFGITSNSVSPSFMETPFTSETDERVVEMLRSSHPLKRLLSTEEVAETVAFLAKASDHINGVNIPINAAENVD